MTGTADTAPEVNKKQFNYKPSFADLKAAANGRWPSILIYFGIPAECFSGNHVDCPLAGHGGKKDFRFDNKNQDGSYICTCSSGSDGFNLLAKFKGIENSEAIKLVGKYLGHNRSDQIQPTYKPVKNNEEKTLSKEKAGEHAFNILANCILKPHPYLQNKSIDKPVLVNTRKYKVGPKQTVYPGALIIPIYDINDQKKLIGAQFINPDGQKFYIKDTKIEDGIHIIQGDSNLPYVDVVEGYGSGFSVHMATEATTIVAFDANGVKGKAERIKQLFSGKKLRFLGDNDSHSRWVGNEAAHTGAFKTDGLVAIPLISGTD